MNTFVRKKGSIVKEMHLNNKLFYLCFLFFLSFTVTQVKAVVPPWVDGDLPDLGEASYYGRYVVVFGDGETVAEAYDQAVKSYIKTNAYASGVRTLITSNEESGTDVRLVADEARTRIDVIDRYETTSLGGIRLYLLIWHPTQDNAIVKPRAFRVVYDRPKEKNITDGGAFLRSLILPGWGHIYKEHYISGIVYMVATPVFLASGIWCTREYQEITSLGASGTLMFVGATLSYATFAGFYWIQLINATFAEKPYHPTREARARYKYLSHSSVYSISPWVAQQNMRKNPMLGASLRISF